MKWLLKHFKKRKQNSEVSSNEITQPSEKDGADNAENSSSMESESEKMDFDTVLRQLTSRVRRNIYEAQKELFAELINAAGVTRYYENGYSHTPMRMASMMGNGAGMSGQQVDFISDNLHKLYFSMSILEKIENEKGLFEVNPADVESLIGLKPMSCYEFEAKMIGWGTEEYWANLYRQGAEADHNLCLSLSWMLWGEILEKCQRIEEEYSQNTENFEDVTIYRDGVPFTLYEGDDIDIVLACDVLERVERCLKDDIGDIEDFGYFNYGNTIDFMFEDGIYIVRSKKIAVKRM